jgi:hypothetical protein
LAGGSGCYGGQLEDRILAQWSDGFQRHVAGALYGPFARAGDSLEGAFSFLAGLGYRACRFEPEGLVPVAVPVTGDFWFMPADDPA